MGSLNVHQSKPSDHDRLGCHPGCPICRQDRLFGAFSPEPIFSHRLRVLLATGVLALSAGAATTSVAAEPDSHQEGVSAPEPEGVPAPDNSNSESPGLPTDGQGGPGQGEAGDDLGQGSGGETALPFEVDPVGGAPEDEGSVGTPGEGDDPAQPLENAPTADPDGGLGLTDPDAPDTINADEVPVPPTEPEQPLAPSPPAAPPPAAPPPAAEDEIESTDREPKRERKRDGRRATGKDRRASDRRAREQPQSNGPVPAPATAPAPTESATLSASAQAESSASIEPAEAPAGAGRFHVVRAGESLWSIATGLLAPGASTGAIALEVHRLWELNRERIGTGDPDLLRVGVTLRLR